MYTPHIVMQALCTLCWLHMLPITLCFPSFAHAHTSTHQCRKLEQALPVERLLLHKQLAEDVTQTVQHAARQAARQQLHNTYSQAGDVMIHGHVVQ